ncbi:bifunctional adenosylcobinamide kinase/adenosylcobinamide-phosphate guanylyltransferase [Enterococcus faecalis]|nr:bifunctional adenosylcobinamide kinase/adenosylcobinamide-phosphate guanylyltransferase [Enterococcus faecalis]
MGKIILVTGGARSGKSTFAESELKEKKSVCYIATSVITFPDPEMEQRVLLHKRQRPASWMTEERFLQVGDFLKQNNHYSAYLIDCVTILTTNLFYYLLGQQFGDDYQKIDEQINQFTEVQKLEIEAKLKKEWIDITKAIHMIPADVILVTNEVGLGIVPESKLSRWFRDILGRINQQLGKEADDVYFVVCGIPTKIK